MIVTMRSLLMSHLLILEPRQNENVMTLWRYKRLMNLKWRWRSCVRSFFYRCVITYWKHYRLHYFPFLIDCLFQVPGESLKLKQLKVLIDEHSTSVLSNFSSKKDALAYLRRKVWMSCYNHLGALSLCSKLRIISGHMDIEL